MTASFLTQDNSISLGFILSRRAGSPGWYSSQNRMPWRATAAYSSCRMAGEALRSARSKSRLSRRCRSLRRTLLLLLRRRRGRVLRLIRLLLHRRRKGLRWRRLIILLLLRRLWRLLLLRHRLRLIICDCWLLRW